MRIAAGWQVAAAPAGSIEDPRAIDGLAWIDANVPGTAAGALRDAGAWSWDTPRAFDAEDWWWRVTVDAAPGPTTLVCDGIATLWDAWWNGEHVASGSNMFVATRIPVVARGGDALVIRCRALAPELANKRPRPRWRVPMLEQQQLRWFRTTLLGRTPGWSPNCPAVGPWRPVRLEAEPPPTIVARLDGDVGIVRVTAPRGRVVVGDVGAEVVDGVAEVRVPHPARWWPHTHGEPTRYLVMLDEIVIGAVGFRTVTLDRRDGDFALSINGVRVFCRGACWTPDAVTLDAPPEDIVASARRANLNMIRIGGTMTYPDRALLDALDANGILLWQDLMFANMDYPDDEALRASIDVEVAQQLAVLASHPCLAIVCGNSEGGQQAAMAGATRDRWEPPLFHVHLRDRVAAALPEIPYVPSSTDGGAYPHQVDAGATSYYGVGAYLRGFDDLRRSGLRFASEALAFANVPDDDGMPPTPRARKARVPRDLGAGWDFDDVRDHYVRELFGVDPVALRAHDHDRYLALGRFATGEVMARAFAEWRRGRSPTRGALVWFLRDLWPGAGWGLLDSRGRAKPCWYAVRRACAPQAIAITDEGNNGLALHAVNDRPAPLELAITATLYRAGEIRVATATGTLLVAGHATAELALATLFEGWYDLSYAFRFGPPQADVIEVRSEIGHAYAFPVGFPARELDVGLSVAVEPGALAITARRFAFGVTIDAAGCVPEDNGFHLAPGETRRIACTGTLTKGTVGALNAETAVRFP